MQSSFNRLNEFNNRGVQPTSQHNRVHLSKQEPLKPRKEPRPFPLLISLPFGAAPTQTHQLNMDILRLKQFWYTAQEATQYGAGSNLFRMVLIHSSLAPSGTPVLLTSTSSFATELRRSDVSAIFNHSSVLTAARNLFYGLKS